MSFDLPNDAPADLVVEQDDFLEHPDLIDEDMDTDEEVQLWRVLFPDGDASLEEEWKEVFRSERRLIADAPLTAAAYGVSAPLTTSGVYSGSGRDLGIADRLRVYGLKVVEVAGWQTRGSSTFHPRGSVDHHTAGGRYGNAPSLNVCINGRSDLPGPLCQVFIARDNTCYVVASGRANHAGKGSYAGVTGNSNVYGIEHENTGTGSEPWREDQRVTAAKAHAALLDWKRSGFVCEHKEWAPTRKIDKWDQSGSDMRNRVANAWKQYDKKELESMSLFTTHEERVEFVKKAYLDIVGREVESQETLDTWVWWIAMSNGKTALDLMTALDKERRLKDEDERKKLKSALEAAIAGIADTAGGGDGASVQEVLDEIAKRLQ